jgi:hypothetical protein
MLVTAAATCARSAAACPVEPGVLHDFDTALATLDRAPTKPPVVISAEATRRSGLTCGQESCVENYCGDTATVSIAFAPIEGGETAQGAIGYRLELVSGEVPESMQHQIGTNLAGSVPLSLTLDFDDVASLDVVLRAVAMDAAGNESTPSEPFVVQFNGCTLAAVGDLCEHEFDPDGSLSYSALDELEPEPVAAASRSASCSLPAPTTQGLAFTALTTALVGLLAWRRRGLACAGVAGAPAG